MKRTLVLLTIFAYCTLAVGSLDLAVFPGMEIPLGSTDSEIPNPYGIGAGGFLSLGHTFISPSWLYLEGGLGYFSNNTDGGDSLSRLNIEAGIGTSLFLGSRLNLRAVAFGGGSQGFYKGETGTYGVFGSRLQLSFIINPAVSLGLGATYRYVPNLYHGLSVTISSGFSFSSGKESRAIEYKDIRMEPVFPILYQYYDENDIGTVRFGNNGRGTINNGEISFFLPNYMSVPKTCGRFDNLKLNEELSCDLTALLSEDILTIIEDKKVPAEIAISYTYLGTEFTNTISQPILVHNRNALTWTDDRKVAAFVSGKDPQVMRFARNSAGIADDSGFSDINKAFRQGMAVLEALRVQGITYVPDPKTPYEDLSQNSEALDYIQFPSQALAFRSGDCDDLTILYDSLLESLGVETAFITVPGHIFPAFSVDLWPDEAERLFGKTEDLIFIDDTTWVPVEITALRQGFLRAWELGAKQWREADAAGNATFYLVHRSWNIYPAVARPASESEIVALPEQATLEMSYRSRIEAFVMESISEREQAYLTDIRVGRNVNRARNALGVLYARHGLLDKARNEFIQLPRTPKVEINLGNIAFLQGEMTEASRFYQNALIEEPQNRAALLGYSRTKYEEGDFLESKEKYTVLAALAPVVADRYAYLGGVTDTARASSSSDNSGPILWDE